MRRFLDSYLLVCGYICMYSIGILIQFTSAKHICGSADILDELKA